MAEQDMRVPGPGSGSPSARDDGLVDGQDTLPGEAGAMNLDPITGEPGAHPVGTAVGTTSGAIAGAFAGSFAGPVGAFVGVVVGAVVGAAAGHESGEELNPTSELAYWRDALPGEPYYDPRYDVGDYQPAWHLGYRYFLDRAGRTWPEVEPDMGLEWEGCKGTSRLSWDEAREPARAAWERANASDA